MDKNIINIDISKRLGITIRNTRPVALKDLSLSLLSFNNQFHKFMEAEANNNPEASTELLIKDVRSGSIVVELVACAMPVVPLLWEGGALVQWFKVAHEAVLWLLGKLERPPKHFSKQDLQEWNKFVEPVARDHGSQMNINVSDSGRVINQFFINSTEAKAIQSQIGHLISDMSLPEENTHRRKVMYWYQTKFDPRSDTGNRAIIDDLYKSSLKVIFENNAVKDAMLRSDPRFSKPWQELAYVVDVEVETVRGVPKMYKVLRYYPEYTFDPDQE